jgi:hypothetical protein
MRSSLLDGKHELSEEFLASPAARSASKANWESALALGIWLRSVGYIQINTNEQGKEKICGEDLPEASIIPRPDHIVEATNGQRCEYLEGTRGHVDVRDVAACTTVSDGKDHTGALV